MNHTRKQVADDQQPIAMKANTLYRTMFAADDDALQYIAVLEFAWNHGSPGDHLEPGERGFPEIERVTLFGVNVRINGTLYAVEEPFDGWGKLERHVADLLSGGEYGAQEACEAAYEEYRACQH